MKTCSTCGTEKNDYDFHKHYSFCIECYNEKQRLSYKEKHHMRCKEYYKQKVLDRREQKRIEEGVYLKKELRRIASKETEKERKEKSKEQAKEYRIKNREKLRLYYKNNRPIINAKLQERMRNDICFRVAHRLRVRIYLCLKKQKTCKSKPMLELMGCTLEDLRRYLESKFLPGMSWENHTRDGWHIDHIKPCSSFDLSKEDEQRKCFHYTNLQPLWAIDNMRKSDKILM